MERYSWWRNQHEQRQEGEKKCIREGMGMGPANKKTGSFVGVKHEVRGCEGWNQRLVRLAGQVTGGALVAV